MSAVEATPMRERPRSGEPLLRLSGIVKHFPITRGIIFQKKVGAVHAVDGVDLDIYPGETLGLVGETGCGKSTLARVAMRLHDATDGTIIFDGKDITRMKGENLRAIRRDMQMIFQDPYASLNPRKTVGTIVGAPLRLHKTVPKNQIKAEVQNLMELVGLNPEHYNRYPHEFSGGQRQRIGVARALALRPKMIVCDEPVSALDVSIQAQILNLLSDLQDEFNLTYLFIAHDLSVVKHISDRVAVMYLGKIAEAADGAELYTEPKHPYTGALLSAVPIADPNLAEDEAPDHPRGRRPVADQPAHRVPVPPPVLQGSGSLQRRGTRASRARSGAHRRLSLPAGGPYHRRAHRNGPWEFRMINAVAVVLLVLSSIFLIVTILHALGKGERPVRHVRRGQQPLRRHVARADPGPHHGRDRDRVGDIGLLALLEVVLDRPRPEPAAGPLVGCPARRRSGGTW